MVPQSTANKLTLGNINISDFSSYTPWSRKIAWIRALFHRVHKICSNDDPLQKNQQHQTFYVMEWSPMQTNEKAYLPILSFNHY